MKDDQLRQRRLVFYEEDVAELDGVLDEFIAQSKSKCAMLVDKEGHMVTYRGDSGNFDIDTISALVAGSFAATREMARLFGESEFSQTLNRGKHDHIQLSLIGDRTLLVAIFDDKTTVGMVQLYANETTAKLEKMFEARLAAQAAEAAAPPSEAAQQGSLEFAEDAKSTLDDLFGE